MHGIAATVFVLASLGAAAPKKSPLPQAAPAPIQHWDVKGIVLGESNVDYLREHVGGSLACNEYTSGADKAIGIDQTCFHSERKCTQIGAKEFCHDAAKIETFAGQEVLISYELHQGVVWLIRIAVETSAFDSVVTTMEAKYGKPVISRSDIQNRMGAHFEQGVAIWAGLDHIVYERYRDRLDIPSDLIFYSSQAWTERENAVQGAVKSAKDDM